MKLGRVLVACFVLIAVLVMTGCVSVYSGERYHFEAESQGAAGEVADGVTAPVFYGFGMGQSKAEAVDDAVSDAIQRAVFLALGDNGLLYREQVAELFDREVDANTYVLESTKDILDWDYEGGEFSMLVSVRLLLPEISELLRSKGVYGGLVQDHIALRLFDQQPPDYSTETPLSEVLGPIGPEWVTGVSPTFLVYYDESQVSDPFTARTAVLMANDYLSSVGFSYIDLQQIESIKMDQEYAFAEETGNSSMLRWIASKLHADYYIDIAVSTSSFARDGSYFADASVSLSCFDSSTAAGRGSMFIQTDEPIGGNTRSSAIDRAVAYGVTQGMAGIMGKVSRFFTADAKRGTAYELIIMKTYQDKVMRAFQAVIAKQVSAVTRTSFSVEESRYTVTFAGTAEELADIVYDTARQFPELRGMYLTYQRGNSLTFHTGM